MFCIIKNMELNEVPMLVAKSFPSKDDAEHYINRYVDKKPTTQISFTIAEVVPLITYKQRLIEEVHIG